MVQIAYSDLIKASPHIFGRDVFALRTDGVHSDFMEHLLSGSNRTLLLAPRGMGKSKSAQLLIAHHILKFPNERVILVSQSHTKATIFMSGIKRALEGSEVVKSVWGDVKGENWRDNSITLATRTVNHTEPNLMAVGAGSSSITGLHAELLVLDDVTDLDTERSSVKSDRLKTWYKTALLPVLTPGGRMWALGTRYGINDLYELLKNTNYNTKIFPAIKSNGEALCPWLRPLVDEVRNGETVVGLETMKRDLGSLIFALQMQNDTSLLLENNIIKARWIQWYTEPPKDPKGIIVSVDPAISEKDDADYTAIQVWCKDDDGNMYLLAHTEEHFTLNATLIQIEKYIEQYSPTMVLIEDIAYQKSIIQELKRRCQTVVVKGVKPSVDKRARLINVSNLFENGVVFFRANCGTERVTDEIIYFPSKHDDCLDACTMALQYYKTGMGNISWLPDDEGDE